MRGCAFFLLIALLAGCGKGGAGSKNASSNSSGRESSSKENGKVYTSSKGTGKGSGGQSSGGQSSGGGAESQLPQPADTADSKTSPASDNGFNNASHGLPVLNPGVPPANKPKPAPQGSH